MERWQTRYIENTRRIREVYLAQAARISEETVPGACHDPVPQAEAARLREENIDLLNRYLFPALDELHSADSDAIAQLAAFADELMDWQTNLDCGIYVVIHDALLSVYRLRKDRNAVIAELYKLGMGQYYLRRFLTDVNDPEADGCAFQNEMLFTEAGSYIRFYDEIDDETTRGYIIRSMANIAICAGDRSRRIAASARTLRVVQDEHYRALAPGLPWDVFVRRTHQQMSSNRSELTDGNLTREELASILDSCYEVFRPEEQAENPSVRWLWPYYEMEFSCGYVNLDTTIRRLERLISDTPDDRYDVSGIYGNAQLPVYYGRLLRDYPALRADPDRVRFLDFAYRKMMRALTGCPPEARDDHFRYTLCAVITDYYEMNGVPTYREITEQILKHFGGELYLRSLRMGKFLRFLADELWMRDSGFFDDIPFLADTEDLTRKKEMLLNYAQDCGLYLDFGLVKMNIGMTMKTRDLFENEFQMYRLHTVSGHDDLAAHPSTECFADVALGHHRWYDGSDGYPERYERLQSAFRQMTDLAAVGAVLVSGSEESIEEKKERIIKGEGTRFSPMITDALYDLWQDSAFWDVIDQI